ncbi:MAG: hypothetical protein AAFX58_05175 [Pseudomonadota bacterium]
MTAPSYQKGRSGTPAVVHLVHGTFARRAGWTEPDSILARRIVRTLGQGTVVESFEWTGANSHAARLRAGAELAEKLRACRGRYIDCPQFVVAHSHGGNVAAYALMDEGARAAVGGVVCLGTPFIHAKGRDLAGTRRLVQWLLAACLAIIAFLLLAAIAYGVNSAVHPGQMYALHTGETQLPRELLESPLLPYYFIAFLLLIAGGIAWVASRSLVWLWRFAFTSGLPGLARMQAVIVESHGARFGDTPVLAVNARGDEAAWWLAWLSRVAGLPYRIWRPSRFLLVGMLTLCGLGALSLWFETGADAGSLPYFAVVVSLLWFILATGITAVAGWLACLAWPAIFRAHALGFGGDDFFKNFLVEISASPVPGDSARVQREVVRTEGTGLRHSRLYQAGSVLNIIDRWFARLGRESRPGQAQAH